MKILLDFFPIALFFLVYKSKDLHFYQQEGLHSAIIAMTIATLVQIIITRIRNGKFEKAQVIGLVLLIGFGGLTIYIDNPLFIMWKVSVLYVVFALALIGSLWVGNKSLLQRMLGKELHLPIVIWTRMTWLWGGGFIAIAIINAYYYVLPSIQANANFFGDGERFGLSGLNCLENAKPDLCLLAQQTEESWVNFKLFGTMGLTFVLILVTVVMMSKHIQETK
ncbi:MAG: putative intracellular septation protein A [Catillopecten margaritatus gill symbiont]|uniref:Inner membrane-spanning protein YciB n=1 Tax=Catillopecten margaritatus gill symbiont TaxID=3083288 RepID=A0AAU6PH43_9GAMM